jgi:hypothetical protein
MLLARDFSKNFTKFADVIGLMGMVYFLLQAILFAHTTISNLDEGAYLYKGLLFARGIYYPFQPYGFWTNKMPLSFLIPGYVQLIFGAGLRTGRYLAVIEELLAMVAVWIAARRTGGKWLATAIIWSMALSPAAIKATTMGVTQPLIACLFAWTLLLTTGEKRPLWQLILGTAIASTMILTRQNMAPVLPLLLLYIFWEYGWKIGFLCALVGIGILVWGHAIYWPQILQIWVDWLPWKPASWEEFSIPAEGIPVWNPSVDIMGRLLSFFQGFRWHWAVLTGSFFSLILWPKRSKVNRTSIFLAMLFFSLLLLHAYAALMKNYCVFCFSPYISFFNIAGLLFIVSIVKSLDTKPSLPRQVLLVIVAIVIAAGVGFSTFEDSGDWLIELPAPRIKGGKILPGLTTLGTLISNKFPVESADLRKILAAGAGAIAGLILIVAVFLVYITVIKRNRANYSYGYVLSVTFLITGAILSPWLQGSQALPDCQIDVIANNEQVGAHLAQFIPPNSKIYWKGGLSVVPMLYVPQAYLYPPQVNDGYSYRKGGNTDRLLRFGLWNDEINQKWLQEAEIILVEESRYSASLKAFLSPDRYKELPRTPTGTSCRDNTKLRIFKKIK